MLNDLWENFEKIFEKSMTAHNLRKNRMTRNSHIFIPIDTWRVWG
jgi:hypothetical protein